MLEMMVALLFICLSVWVFFRIILPITAWIVVLPFVVIYTLYTRGK